VNGNPVVTDPVNYTPALANLQNQLHTFSQLWTAAPGVYQVCVITSDPNGNADQNPADDTTCITISVFDTVSVTAGNPYCTDFESGPQWISVNALTFNLNQNSWELGTPSQTVLNSARSGVNAWMTDLDTNYISRDTSGLFTPVFSVDNTRCYKLSFWHKFVTDPFADGGLVEFSTDNAITWGHLGFYSSQIPTWYNSAFVTGLGGSPGYPGWSGTQATWTLAEQEINFWNTGQVMFRFRFGSDNFSNFEGWAIDDFCFEEITGPCTVSLSDPASSELVLGQNHPNPFTQSSSVDYSLPSSGKVRITITDVLGREIAVPVNGLKPAGTHQFTIKQAAFVPGIYYYTLDFDGEKITRKMVVNK
jgi:hypothetical protein